MNTYAFRTQHNSLQFSDPSQQQKQDVKKIFAEGTRYPDKTGTEAGVGAGRNREFLARYAEQFNHIINFGGDSWVAIDRDIIKRGSVERGDLLLASNDEMDTPGYDRIMPWIGFDHLNPEIGRIYQATVHYAVKGDKPGTPNYKVNQKCAQKIGDWMQEVARGSSLALLNGDFNINDRILDVALGENFTTMADELGTHQNTGRGPIDGICSYNRDGRVSAHQFTVLDDTEFHLFADHYTCRGTWEIEALKEAK